jgi:DNA-binding XRE family transcriptional regulator
MAQGSLPHEGQFCPVRALRFCSGIFEPYPAGRYILFPDGKNNRKGIPALPFSTSVISVPKPLSSNYRQNPQTLGEKLRNKRIERKLLQKDVAVILGVCEDSITFWENNRVVPQIRYQNKIAAFLDQKNTNSK